MPPIVGKTGERFFLLPGSIILRRLSTNSFLTLSFQGTASPALDAGRNLTLYYSNDNATIRCLLWSAKKSEMVFLLPGSVILRRLSTYNFLALSFRGQPVPHLDAGRNLTLIIATMMQKSDASFRRQGRV